MEKENFSFRESYIESLGRSIFHFPSSTLYFAPVIRENLSETEKVTFIPLILNPVRSGAELSTTKGFDILKDFDGLRPGV